MSTTEIRIITGNVTADPELRHTPDSVPVTDIRIAVNHRAKTDTGEWIDAGTDYYTVPATTPCRYGDAKLRTLSSRCAKGCV